MDSVVSVGPADLAQIVKSKSEKVLIVDARTFCEFNTSHIISSVNVWSSKIRKKRLRQNLISTKELLAQACHVRFRDMAYDDVIVYDQNSVSPLQVSDDSFLYFLLIKLTELFSKVSLLEHGFLGFQAQFHEMCEDTTNRYLVTSLSQPCLPVTNCGPTKILPFLYLGSQFDANNKQWLQDHNITYELNVSTSCPKPEFLNDANFLRVPVNDNFTAKLFPFFEEAFRFIDKVREIGGHVLVHCLAGISRSPTVVISYVMKHLKIHYDEAYRYVKIRRHSISPNINFVGQLLELDFKLFGKNFNCISMRSPLYLDYERDVLCRNSGLVERRYRLKSCSDSSIESGNDPRYSGNPTSVQGIRDFHTNKSFPSLRSSFGDWNRESAFSVPNLPSSRVTNSPFSDIFVSNWTSENSASQSDFTSDKLPSSPKSPSSPLSPDFTHLSSMYENDILRALQEVGLCTSSANTSTELCEKNANGFSWKANKTNFEKFESSQSVSSSSLITSGQNKVDKDNDESSACPSYHSVQKMVRKEREEFYEAKKLKERAEQSCSSPDSVPKCSLLRQKETDSPLLGLKDKNEGGSVTEAEEMYSKSLPISSSYHQTLRSTITTSVPIHHSSLARNSALRKPDLQLPRSHSASEAYLNARNRLEKQSLLSKTSSNANPANCTKKSYSTDEVVADRGQKTTHYVTLSGNKDLTSFDSLDLMRCDSWSTSGLGSEISDWESVQGDTQSGIEDTSEISLDILFPDMLLSDIQNESAENLEKLLRFSQTENENLETSHGASNDVPFSNKMTSSTSHEDNVSSSPATRPVTLPGVLGTYNVSEVVPRQVVPDIPEGTKIDLIEPGDENTGTTLVPSTLVGDQQPSSDNENDYGDGNCTTPATSKKAECSSNCYSSPSTVISNNPSPRSDSDGTDYPSSPSANCSSSTQTESDSSDYPSSPSVTWSSSSQSESNSTDYSSPQLMSWSSSSQSESNSTDYPSPPTVISNPSPRSGSNCSDYPSPMTVSWSTSTQNESNSTGYPSPSSNSTGYPSPSSNSTNFNNQTSVDGAQFPFGDINQETRELDDCGICLEENRLNRDLIKRGYHISEKYFSSHCKVKNEDCVMKKDDSITQNKGDLGTCQSKDKGTLKNYHLKLTKEIPDHEMFELKYLRVPQFKDMPPVVHRINSKGYFNSLFLHGIKKPHQVKRRLFSDDEDETDENAQTASTRMGLSDSKGSRKWIEERLQKWSDGETDDETESFINTTKLNKSYHSSDKSVMGGSRLSDPPLMMRGRHLSYQPVMMGERRLSDQPVMDGSTGKEASRVTGIHLACELLESMEDVLSKEICDIKKRTLALSSRFALPVKDISDSENTGASKGLDLGGTMRLPRDHLTVVSDSFLAEGVSNGKIGHRVSLSPSHLRDKAGVEAGANLYRVKSFPGIAQEETLIRGSQGEVRRTFDEAVPDLTVSGSFKDQEACSGTVTYRLPDSSWSHKRGSPKRFSLSALDAVRASSVLVRAPQSSLRPAFESCPDISQLIVGQATTSDPETPSPSSSSSSFSRLLQVS